MTLLNFLHTQLLSIKKKLFVVMILCVTNSCLADSLDKETFDSNSINLKLWQKPNLTQKQKASKNLLEEGTFVEYSHSFSERFGLALSIDSYLYTNKSDNSFAWVVGFVGELFKLNYHIDQKEKNQYVEVITHYPLNESLNLTGYAGNKNDGIDEYRDYSVGLAYSVNTSVEISVGITDREVKKSDAEGNVFLNINGIF